MESLKDDTKCVGILFNQIFVGSSILNILDNDLVIEVKFVILHVPHFPSENS